MKTAEQWAAEFRAVAKDRPSAMGATLECVIRDAMAAAGSAWPAFGPSKDWGRSLDHLLYGPEFMAKGKDWTTTEIIRRKLVLHDDLVAALNALVLGWGPLGPREYDDAIGRARTVLARAADAETGVLTGGETGTAA